MNTNYLTLENVSHNHSFVIATYKLLTATIIAATAGAFLGLKYNEMLAPYYIGLVILEFIFLFGVMFTKNKPGLNVSLLFIFVTLTGITLGPLLTATLALSNGAEIILQSLVMTSVAFGGLTFYAMTTTRSFIGIRKYLIIALLIIIVAMIINIFVGSSLLMLGISVVSAFLFSMFIIADTQALYSGKYETPVDGALSMYLNILNLFISLLNILRAIKGEN